MKSLEVVLKLYKISGNHIKSYEIIENLTKIILNHWKLFSNMFHLENQQQCLQLSFQQSSLFIRGNPELKNKHFFQQNQHNQYGL